MNAAYIAGLFDREGSIGVYRFSGKSSGSMLRTQLNQNAYEESTEVLSELHGYFQGNLHTYKSTSGKKYYNWQLSNQKALKFLEWIFPFLRLKRKEAELAMEWQKTKPRPITQ